MKILKQHTCVQNCACNSPRTSSVPEEWLQHPHPLSTSPVSQHKRKGSVGATDSWQKSFQEGRISSCNQQRVKNLFEKKIRDTEERKQKAIGVTEEAGREECFVSLSRRPVLFLRSLIEGIVVSWPTFLLLLRTYPGFLLKRFSN